MPACWGRTACAHACLAGAACTRVCGLMGSSPALRLRDGKAIRVGACRADQKRLGLRKELTPAGRAEGDPILHVLHAHGCHHGVRAAGGRVDLRLTSGSGGSN
jgi:hypothetical protein